VSSPVHVGNGSKMRFERIRKRSLRSLRLRQRSARSSGHQMHKPECAGVPIAHVYYTYIKCYELHAI